MMSKLKLTTLAALTIARPTFRRQRRNQPPSRLSSWASSQSSNEEVPRTLLLLKTSTRNASNPTQSARPLPALSSTPTRKTAVIPVLRIRRRPISLWTSMGTPSRIVRDSHFGMAPLATAPNMAIRTTRKATTSASTCRHRLILQGFIDNPRRATQQK